MSSPYLIVPAELRDVRLPPGPKQLLLTLLEFVNDAGVCWPSYAQLAERACCSKPSVVTYVKRLVDEGLIEIERQTNVLGGNYRCRFYIPAWARFRSVRQVDRSGQNLNRQEKPNTQKKPKVPCTTDLRRVSARVAEEFRRNYDPGTLGGAGLAKAPCPTFVAEIRRLDQTWSRRLNLVPGDKTADVAERLRRFFADRNAPATPQQLLEMAKTLNSATRSLAMIDQMLHQLAKDWAPHWRRPSSPAKLKQLLDQTPLKQDVNLALTIMSIRRRIDYHLRTPEFGAKGATHVSRAA